MVPGAPPSRPLPLNGYATGVFGGYLISSSAVANGVVYQCTPDRSELIRQQGVQGQAEAPYTASGLG